MRRVIGGLLLNTVYTWGACNVGFVKRIQCHISYIFTLHQFITIYVHVDLIYIFWEVSIVSLDYFI